MSSYKPLLLMVLVLNLLFAEHRIAVLPFQNNGDSTNNYLQRGIADMFTTAFSQQDGFTVIERSRVADLLKEMELSLTGVVDEKNAVELGTLSGANQVVLGSFITLGSEIRIDARLVDVAKGEVIKGTAQSGTASRLEEVDNTVEKISRTMAESIVTKSGGTIVGDPKKQSLLEMYVTNFGAYTITINGKMMDFTDGYVSQMQLAPGTHDLLITRGLFRKKRIIEETIEIPGGYHIKMRFDSRKKTVTTYASTPLQEDLKESTKESVTLVKTTNPLNSVNLQDVISGSLFMNIMHQVQSEVFFDTQEAILSARISNNAISTAQLKRMLENFTFEDDRLKVAKKYYGNVIDKENYLEILSLFSHESSKKELILWESKQ